MQTFKIYRLEIRSPLNEPYSIYMRGGRDGLCDEDRYVVLGQIEGETNYLMLNITTGIVVGKPQPLERFVEEKVLWARNDAEAADRKSRWDQAA
ncbi:MAG: hypothetical protein EOP83_10845 [Verrucomicrobiaceae bacterium]|nr:MAG: hypothetical protein EOP83_10845 [Verrucomicrobiaceae bacterium]